MPAIRLFYEICKMEYETKLPEYNKNEELGSLSQRIDWGLRQLNVPST